MSDHTVMVGSQTNKIIDVKVLSKIFSTFLRAYGIIEKIVDRDYPKNIRVTAK